jgi:hypothetical protein
MTRIPSLAALFAVATLLLACGAYGASPAPTTSPAASAATSPTASPTSAPSASLPPITNVGSTAQAAAVVFATQGINRISPSNPSVIGQSVWYDAAQDASGYSVTVTAGAGDCQAGCIQQHSWTYHVGPDGTVNLVSDQGDDITLVPAAGFGDAVTLNLTLAAGPTCPVERNPPDPNCAPRPIANTKIDVYDVSGSPVTSATSDGHGLATVQLPAGAYYVVAAPADGVMGQAQPQAFAAVLGDTVNLTFMYDTGIR